ncbi:MAG: pentapeptide repeat-containing protein [Actinobacteria bacterium]|nr:pentapeptide repeat-containing protein [Actinomycetota bacterium]
MAANQPPPSPSPRSLSTKPADEATACLMENDRRPTCRGRVHVRFPNLPGARPVGTNLSGTSLGSVNLRRSDLSRANPRLANLSGSDLSPADLMGAELIRANRTGADPTGANAMEQAVRPAGLTRADLRPLTSIDDAVGAE